MPGFSCCKLCNNCFRRENKGILQNAETVSRQAAIEKAAEEYKKYRKPIVDLPTPAERDYLENLQQMQKKLGKRTKMNKNEGWMEESQTWGCTHEDGDVTFGHTLGTYANVKKKVAH